MRVFTEYSRILNEEDVLIIHNRMLKEEGGLPGIHPGKLSGALSRVQSYIVYEGLSDLYEIAALYAIAIAQGHPFNDANKRTAFTSMIIFLAINAIICSPPNNEITPFMETVAKKEIDSEKIVKWLEKYSIEC